MNKAQAALEFVKEIAAQGASATDVHNAFFGNGGKFGELFPTRSEREAFVKTPEYEQIKQIRLSLHERERAASAAH
jgi:hypothetical protein